MKGESRNAPPFSWKSISDRRNSGLLANHRAYRVIVTFKVWGGEFPSMVYWYYPIIGKELYVWKAVCDR